MAAVERPLSGKEWRGRKMGAKEELEWRSQCVGEGRQVGFREKKDGGGCIREGRLIKREKVLIEERGATEVG